MAGCLTVERALAPEERLEFRVLETVRERLRGLLGTNAAAMPVALMGCSSVHTFGMRYRIDVAFVSRGGIVVGVRRSVPPGCVLSHGRAWLTLERPHGCGPWLEAGERVRLTRGIAAEQEMVS